MRATRSVQLFALVLVGTAATFALGWVIGYWKTYEPGVSAQFARTLGYREWTIFVFVQIGVWFAATAIGVARLRTVSLSGSVWIRLAFTFSLAAVALGLSFGFVGWVLHLSVGVPEPHHGLRVLMLDVLGVIGSAASAIGMLTVWPRAEQLRDNAAALSSPREVVSELDRLWRDLNLHFRMLGLIVALATLADSAIKQAVQNAPLATFPNHVRPAALPDIATVAFGLGGAFFVALLWAPGFLALRQTAAAAVDALHPLPHTVDGSSWPDVLAVRSKVLAELHGSIDTIGALRSGLLIAGPLITSLLGQLLPK